MPGSAFLDRLRHGDVLLGLCISYPAPGLIEGMCQGWDFIWIGGQHGQIGYTDASQLLRAAAGVNVQTLLRTPGSEPATVGLLADLAPSALMIPMINTAEQARALVKAVRFPPQGERSYGGRRPIDLFGRDYYRRADPVVVAQIETPEAATNAKAIIQTDGIDALFFGADDMKVSLNLPIDTSQWEHEALREAMRQTAEAARDAGKAAGCVAATAEAAHLAIGMGYRILVAGADASFLRTAASAKLKELQALFEPGAHRPRPVLDGHNGNIYG